MYSVWKQLTVVDYCGAIREDMYKLSEEETL